MRFALALVLGIAVVTLAGSTYTASGEDKKDKVEAKKFEGVLSCTKCSLNETKGCGHALIVKVDNKEVKYYLKDKGGKEAYHKDCCQADVKAVVTGIPGEEDGKKIIKEPKVEIKK